MSKREKIIRMMAEQPELSLKEIAKRVKVAPQYVYTVKWQARDNSKFVSKIFEAVKATKKDLPQNQPADLVNKPPHYTAGGIDFLDYAEAKGLTENAYLFNVVKYVSRAGKKVGSNPVEDLKKAEFYLKREIARRQSA